MVGGRERKLEGVVGGAPALTPSVVGSTCKARVIEQKIAKEDWNEEIRKTSLTQPAPFAPLFAHD